MHEEIERYHQDHGARRSEDSGLRDLRWTLEHVFEITPDQIERLKAIGVGVRVQDHDYIRNDYSSWKAGPAVQERCSRAESRWARARDSDVRRRAESVALDLLHDDGQGRGR